MSPRGGSRIPKRLVWPTVGVCVALFLALPELFPGNSRLYEAIRNGDLARAEALLADGANPNSQSSGLSGLGGGFESDLSGQYSPLMYAIYHNEADIALALVKAGATVEVRNPVGNTALIAAANQDMTEVVRALLERGADPNAENPNDGSTALYQGRNLNVLGKPIPKTFADPEIEGLLRAAGAR